MWYGFFGGERRAKEFSNGVATGDGTQSHNTAMTSMTIISQDRIVTGGRDNLVKVSTNDGTLERSIADFNSYPTQIVNDGNGSIIVGCANGDLFRYDFTDCTKEDIIIVSAEVFVCSEPALGKDKELFSGTATLDANITLQSGETIAWYKDGNLISGATSTTYTAVLAGTYKAVTTRPGCTKEDEIIIYDEGAGPKCSSPALGNDVELIGGSVTSVSYTHLTLPTILLV